MIALPEPIRHQILSLLPTADAMAAAQLSKSWKHDWLSLPFLNFDKQFYEKTSETASPKQYLSPYMARYYYDFLYRTLEMRSALTTQQTCFSHLHNLQRLCLYLPSFDYNFDFPRLVDKLLEYAFSCFQIEELELKFFPYNYSFLLELPGHVNVHSLKSLSLNSMAVNQRTVDTIAHTCPFLELFKLHDCSLRCRAIEIKGFSKLSELCFMFIKNFKNGTLVLDLPSLHSLYFSPRASDRNECFDIEIIRAGELKTLSLHDCGLSYYFLQRVLPRLPSLEKLELQQTIIRGGFRVVSPSLKHLIVKLERITFRDFYIDTPNLEHFIYFHEYNDASWTMWEDNAYQPLYHMDNFAPEKATVKLRAENLKSVNFAELLRKINRQSKYMEVQIGCYDLCEISECDDNFYYYKPCPEIKHVVLLNQNSKDLLQSVDRALRLFTDAETVVVSQRKDRSKEVDQSSSGRLSVDSYDYTLAVFEAMN